MKRNLLLTIFLSAIVGCAGPSKKKEEPSFELLIKADTTTPEIEKNLKAQYLEYYTAATKGDADKAFKYIYPGTIKYLRAQYPDEYSEEEVRNIFTTTKDQVDGLKGKTDYEFDFEVSDPLKKMQYKDDLIYVIVTYLKAKRNLREFSTGEEIICFSFDGGENWSFLSNDKEMAGDVLRHNYPAKVVEEINERQ